MIVHSYPHLAPASRRSRVLRAAWLAGVCSVHAALFAQTAPAQAGTASPPPAEAAQLINVPAEILARNFAPYATDRAALSPDGHYIAYTLREAGRLSVVVLEVDHPEKVLSRVQVGTDETSTPFNNPVGVEKTAAVVRWMKWVTPTRLVVETNRNFAFGSGDNWVNLSGAIFALDADGKNARALVTPEDLATQTFAMAAEMGKETESENRVLRPDEERPSQIAAAAEDPTYRAEDAKTGQTLRRAPRIIDLDPTAPAAVLLRSQDPRNYTLYRLDGVSGKLTRLSDELAELNHTPLLDRQGKPRVAIASSTLVPWPHPYRIEESGGLKRMKPLDELVGGTTFMLAPEGFFGPRGFPVGFDEKASLLYYASNVGRNTFGLYSFDLAAGKPGSLAIANPDLDLVTPSTEGFAVASPLVFDRYSRMLMGIRIPTAVPTVKWLRPEWQAVQTSLEAALPGRTVELLEWSESATRFLVRASSPSDPGAFYVFDAPTKASPKPRLAEFVQSAPWIDRASAGKTVSIRFNDALGRPLNAVLTLPGNDRAMAVGLVVLFGREPWTRVSSEFDPEVQALAEMGLAVVRINGRGAFGFGTTRREALRKDGFEDAQVEDAIATIDYLKKYLPINLKKVSAMGTGWGGLVALRAIETHAERFRCGVALDPIVDPANWLGAQRWGNASPVPALVRPYYGDDARLSAKPLLADAAKLRRPVLILSYPGLDGDARSPAYLDARQFAMKVRGLGGAAEFEDISPEAHAGLPLAKAQLYKRLERFMNERMFKYDVEIGQSQVLPDLPAPETLKPKSK